MKTYESLQVRMERIFTLTEQMREPSIIALARFLDERISKPESFVVMLGETSSGKTTLINGLLGYELIKTGASPTTGTVIELMDDRNLKGAEEFYAVNRDATLEEISSEMFRQLSLEPDGDLQRLRVVTKGIPMQLTDLRLFDTPGYGSIYEQHDEMLKEFIPNSDILIYVVSYRVGFKENDHHFMKFIHELVNRDTDVVLVVNRAPKESGPADKRVQEIVDYAEDCLHRKLCCHIVHSVIVEEGPRLPEATALWDHIRTLLQSEHRQASLFKAFRHYQKSLLLDMKQHAEKFLAQTNATEDDKAYLKDALNELLAVEKRAMDKIESEFDKLGGKLGKHFENARNLTARRIEAEVGATNKWVSKDECIGFIQAHLLPLHLKNETKTIANYIQDKLERLDEEIQSMLNTAVVQFETTVDLRAAVYTPMLLNLSNRVAQKAAGAGLNAFFKQFGGAGGAGAGVANAAKTGLKKLGNLFGKTFSRETHNTLAQFLKRIGATSTRAVTAAAAVIVEGIFYLIDSVTWQSGLIKQVNKALDGWQNETLDLVGKDLNDLKELNLSNIREYFNDYKEACQFQEPEDVAKVYDPVKLIKQIDELLNRIQDEEEQLYD